MAISEILQHPRERIVEQGRGSRIVEGLVKCAEVQFGPGIFGGLPTLIAEMGDRARSG